MNSANISWRVICLDGLRYRGPQRAHWRPVDGHYERSLIQPERAIDDAQLRHVLSDLNDVGSQKARESRLVCRGSSQLTLRRGPTPMPSLLSQSAATASR